MLGWPLKTEKFKFVYAKMINLLNLNAKFFPDMILSLINVSSWSKDCVFMLWRQIGTMFQKLFKGFYPSWFFVSSKDEATTPTTNN